jgi:hypothetical protein
VKQNSKTAPMKVTIVTSLSARVVTEAPHFGQTRVTDLCGHL